MQHRTSNKIIKLVRKRIDIDGLTKIPDQITSRMVQKERSYQLHIENLNEQIRRMQRFVFTLIRINNNQVKKPNFLKRKIKRFFIYLEYPSPYGCNITK
jgi:hypothetical protein